MRVEQEVQVQAAVGKIKKAHGDRWARDAWGLGRVICEWTGHLRVVVAEG